MQHTTGVAVLATHLAGTDRRALSQAWYSALHLAAGTPGGPPRAAHHPPLEFCGARGALRDAGTRGAAGGRERIVRARATAAAAARREATSGATERRVPASQLGQRIERALVRRTPCRMPASFTVRAADGRVHLFVRSDGVRTRIVAICADAIRERVERALAHARFALAASCVHTEAA